jgi:hypothetical protein
LNDVSRYWRTIAVDYQAKVWQRLDAAGWGLRYLKLRVTRKLTFAGSIVPLLLVSVRQPHDVGQFLTDQFVELPPLARLAQLARDLGDDPTAREHLGAILASASAFVGFISDAGTRAAIESIASPEDAPGSEEFERIRALSADLQQHLQALFLDSRLLGELGRKYLVF